MSDPSAVAEAADRLVDAFARHDRDAYFACFAPDATFLFHTTVGLLPSRDAYASLWRDWEAEGFRVLGCTTSNRRIDLVTTDIAILTHEVRTRLAGVDDEQYERETIVFRQDADGWLAIHEHLSPAPEEVGA